MGFAAAPVIKVTANADICEIMSENFDLNLSDIIDGSLSIKEGGEEVFEKVISTADGNETASEKLGHREFSLYRISPILT